MNINEVMKCLKCCWLNHIRSPLEEVRNTFHLKTVMFLLQTNKEHYYKSRSMKCISLCLSHSLLTDEHSSGSFCR